MSELDALLAGIVSDPLEETRWLVLADWLQEHDDLRRAELLRLHRKLIATCCEPDAHPGRSEWQSRMVELLVARVKPCVPQQTLTLPGGVEMMFSFIPPGAFLMGSDHPDGSEDERPVHRVEIARGFFLGVHPVTQSQWAAVMGTDPSYFKGPNRPVETVSWDDAEEFCAKLSELTGREPASGLREGQVELPTEAEWEYACRAGTTTEYHFGDVLTTDLANYDGNVSWNGSPKGVDREQTTDVGTFPANGWGLHDVHGNVWEWCASAYREYPWADESDLKDSNYNLRMLRGGGWYDDPDGCRAAFRSWFAPAYRDYVCGFRVCFRLD
ncbi:MAG: SUMF1/EgtB/PvdO family nonheme iron enzyme [Gemmataceae bacterium]|nr:SUMF1/EgtB/PvdO family nonheme iron enzyme [Gemmataceae bacterium]